MILESYGDMLIKANPDKEGVVNKGLLCGKGKWGFDCSMLEDKLDAPLIKNGDSFREADYHEALTLIAKKMQSTAAKYCHNHIGVAISDRYTNEEAYAIKSMAEAIGAKVFSANNRASGIRDVIGHDASPNTIDELLSTNLILAIGYNASDNPVIAIKMKQAAEAGVKTVLINPEGYPQHISGVSKEVYAEDLGFLKEVAKAIIDSGKAVKAEGYDEFAAGLESVTVSDEAKEIADMYLGAKKAMIVFNQNFISVEAATLIGDIAVLSGHIGSPRDGILQIKAKNNSQGLVDMGITAGAEELENLKALFVFGEEFDVDRENLEFLAVCDTHMTDLAAKADVVIPGTGFASTYGTYTNTERRLQLVEAAIDEDVELSNWEVAAEIMEIFEVECPWEDTDDISREMDDYVPAYKYGEIGEVLGGVLMPVEPKLVSVGADKFADPLKCTDSLMNVIAQRLPKPANPTE